MSKHSIGGISRTRRILTVEIPRFFLLAVLIGCVMLFGAINKRFLTLNNLMNVLNTASIMGMMALGSMMTLSVGELNFAASSMASVSGTVVGLLAGVYMPYWAAVACGIASSIFIGVLCGVLSFKIGLPSFVTTLGMSKIVEGCVCLIVANKTLYDNRWPAVFKWMGLGKVFGAVPVALVLFLIMAAAIWVMLDKTRLGRYIGSVGANKVACLQMGINPLKIKMIAFGLSGALSGLAGIMSCSQLASVPLLPGGTMMMTAIPSAMLGATFFRPGRYNVPGTVVAIILMNVITLGIVSIGAPNPYIWLVKGIIFIISVGFIAMTREGGLPAVQLARS